MIKKLFDNCRKPKGKFGTLMVKTMNIGHKPISVWGMSHMGLKTADHVLDIGCGGGGNIQRMLSICSDGKVDGVDYSPASVDASRNTNTSELGKRCTIKEGNVLSLPFEDNTYDIVTAFETIYFWPDIRHSFSEVYRVLKDNGRFGIVCELGNPDKTFWTKVVDMNIYSTDDISAHLEAVGFSVKSVNRKRDWYCVLAEKTAP